MRERLERLIDEMVERGILFEDAVGAFERTFIAKVLDRAEGNVTAAARGLRRPQDVLERADQALYRAKRQGRDRVVRG